MSPAESAVLNPPTLDESAVERLQRRMKNPFMLPLFMLAKLPLGLFAGLRVRSLETDRCTTSLPYGWRTTNPFRSIYFAAQSMAAELSTGALAKLAVEASPASVAMLITGLEAEFGKKANAEVKFTCEDGEKIFAAVCEAAAGDEPVVVRAATVGRMGDGTEVSRFVFTWSFKRRQPSS